MKNPRPFLLAPAVVSLLGLLFCLWVLFTGGKALCITDGCALFQDFRLAGISLWQAGCVLFSLLLALCILRAPALGLFCSAAALAADIVLLGIMFFTAPCMNCLIVGGFIAVAYFAFLRATSLTRRARRAPLLLIWFALFLFDFGNILKDTASPWTPLPHEGQTSVQVFFSPSCRACQTLLTQADRMNDAVWYPVAEDTRDIWVIDAMAEKIAQGLPLQKAALEAEASIPPLLEFEDDLSWKAALLRPDMLVLQFRLWKNQAAVLDAGSDRLPFVQFMGLPSFLRPEASAAQTSDTHHSASDTLVLPDLGVSAFCGGEESSCDDEPASSSPGGLIDTSGMF